MRLTKYSCASNRHELISIHLHSSLAHVFQAQLPFRHKHDKLQVIKVPYTDICDAVPTRTGAVAVVLYGSPGRLSSSVLSSGIYHLLQAYSVTVCLLHIISSFWTR